MQQSATLGSRNADKVESMGIRFMLSNAATAEGPRASPRATPHNSEIPRMGSGHSRVSTVKWREGVQQRPIRRCLLSAMFAVMVCTAVLCAASITAVWVPSAFLADEELIKASKDRLISGADQVSKELLNYLQVASTQAWNVGRMYNMSVAHAPANAPERYLDEFGAGTWSILVQEPTISSILLAHARKPELVNPADPTCDTDVALLSATYKAKLNSETTGTGLDVDDDALKYTATDASPAGKARMNGIVGKGNLADPLEWNKTIFFRNCNEWLGNKENLWEMQNLPGDWAQDDTGIREAIWLPGTVVVGSKEQGTQALYKKVFFPLEGPAWANRSAFGAVSIRVGSRKIQGQDNTQTLSDILMEVAGEGFTLFVITGEGMLLASSTNQEVELLEQDGGIKGLVPADSELVQEPIRGVAAKLIKEYCSTDEHGNKKCSWADLVKEDWETESKTESMNDYYVTAKFMKDDKASGLNCLLVNMEKEEDIYAPAGELNSTLAVHGSYIFLVAVAMAFFVARMVTRPFRTARDNMFLLGDLKVEDALENNRHASHCAFTETKDLRLSFAHAATCLKAWRELEIERRMHLEDEREKRIQNTIEKAVRGAGKLVHPMVLISADAFSKLESLTSYEELRDSGKLVFLDTEEALANFRAGHSIVFLSHQWLAWGFPDNTTKTHLNAMKSAIRCAADRVGSDANSRCQWNNLYVWVDYCSIAQEHRGMQMLAVSSLPVYASSADIFVIVAPPTEHQSTHRCDLHTYNARGWCRAEMLAKICSSGLMNFFIFGEEGKLEQVTEERLPALSMYVFEGEFSCCQQRHVRTSCDKEALVEPVLGLYSLVLRQVRAQTNLKYMQPILEHICNSKERFFPPTHKFQVEGSGAEERDLFGPLVESTERYVEEMMLTDCAVSFNSARLTASGSAGASAS